VYSINNPFISEIVEHPTHAWKYGLSEHTRHLEQNRLWWGLKGDAKYPRLKQFLSEMEDGMVPIDIWDYKNTGTTDEGGLEMKNLFGAALFDNPKPPRLIQRMLRLVSGAAKDELILDFFCGSASTSHAVMALNAEDGGIRRCISVQLPEPCDESSEAFKAGFRTIADIAKERIRRAGAKIRAEWEEKNAAREAAKARSEEKKGEDLFSESAASANNPQSPISNLQSLPPDTGFRVFKLAPSNFKRWDGEAAAASKEALVQQMEATLDHIAAEATADSLLFEILLKAGYQLTCPLEKLTLAGHTVWSVDGGSLFVCVESRIDAALVDAVAEKHPVQFICLDRALQGSDSLKVNTLETFRAAQPEIQFRTV
jgi:adenine-specific DNA-methyltransferase